MESLKAAIIGMTVVAVLYMILGVVLVIFNLSGFGIPWILIKVGAAFCLPAVLWNIPRFFRALFRRPPVPRKQRRI